MVNMLLGFFFGLLLCIWGGSLIVEGVRSLDNTIFWRVPLGLFMIAIGASLAFGGWLSFLQRPLERHLGHMQDQSRAPHPPRNAEYRVFLAFYCSFIGGMILLVTWLVSAAVQSERIAWYALLGLCVDSSVMITAALGMAWIWRSPKEPPALALMPSKVEDYQAYLRSPEWQERRQVALARAGHRCQLCYSAKRLEVHHRTYERIGNEDLTDLITLCRACHQRHHGRSVESPI